MYWLLEILYDWLYCLETDQLPEWFKADYLTDKLTLLSGDWTTDRMIHGQLIDWLTNSTLPDWPTDWVVYG